MNIFLQKRGKTLVVFENSVHYLMIEEKEKYGDVIVNVVLKECQNN